MRITHCRFCQGKLSKVLSLGKMPIVNYFPAKEELVLEKKYPLEFCVCQQCGLAQLGFLIPPQRIFRAYHFLTGASKPLVLHLNKLSDLCIKECKLNSRSNVLDIGCNDGSFLLNFKKNKMKTLGVEPAFNMAQFAQSRGLTVIPEFFDYALAKNILAAHGRFDLITATRVLANIIELNDFVRGVKLLLSPKGTFVVEVGSLSEMLTKFQFDAIYHEHFSYFSFATLQKLIKKHGLSIFKLEKSLFQGGELRIFATHSKRVTRELRMDEGISENDFATFAKNVRQFKRNLRKLFTDLKGTTVAGFGAPAKGVTLLNYCGIGKDHIAFIVDSTPLKQGRFLPGLHIPIFPEEHLEEKSVDYILLLAWNYKDQILRKIRKLTKKGTKVIIPFPKLEVIIL